MGKLISKLGYRPWLELLSLLKGINPKDSDYDYQVYYNYYPKEAWSMLFKDGHFNDIGKKPTHPTFSDESYYSRKGQKGGHWEETPERWIYRLSEDQANNDWDVMRTLRYALEAEDGGFQVQYPRGELPVINGEIYGGVLPNVEIKKK